MIYFVRHGKTDWNNQKKMQGIIDIPLNDEGIEYAKKLAEKLKDIRFSKVFCSPLIRAKQTCDLILEQNAYNDTIEYLDCIKERDYLDFAGKPKSSFDYNSFWDFSKEQSFENFFNFAWPIAKFIFNELTKNYVNKDVLIVSHGGVSKIFELFLSQNSVPPEFLGDFLPKNSEVICYDLKKKYNKQYYLNLNEMPKYYGDETTSIITPNLVLQNVKLNSLNILSEFPKPYKREAIILSKTDGKIAIFSFKNTSEVKFPGWQKIDCSIESQIKRRTGFNIIPNSLKQEHRIIEITFNNKHGDIIYSTYYSAMIDENSEASSPDFNDKEIKEGGILEFYDISTLIKKFNEKIKFVKELNIFKTDPDFRPIESKYSIMVRDKTILEIFLKKLLKNYFIKMN